MAQQTIEENVRRIKAELEKGNPYGERVLLVAATKMQTAEAINAAIAAGVDAVAENKPQEFRDKNALVAPCPRHFIGHLQTNKVKYLVGKIQLYHSIDRDELAAELSRQSVKANVLSDILVQVNIGDEATKGGYTASEAIAAAKRLNGMDGLRVRGFMAMLPESGDEAYLRGLARRMRAIYESARLENGDIRYLSMGMSGDYKLCVEEGSNVVRLGSTIFGARDYGK